MSDAHEHAIPGYGEAFKSNSMPCIVCSQAFHDPGFALFFRQKILLNLGPKFNSSSLIEVLRTRATYFRTSCFKLSASGVPIPNGGRNRFGEALLGVKGFCRLILDMCSCTCTLDDCIAAIQSTSKLQDLRKVQAQQLTCLSHGRMDRACTCFGMTAYVQAHHDTAEANRSETWSQGDQHFKLKWKAHS